MNGGPIEIESVKCLILVAHCLRTSRRRASTQEDDEVKVSPKIAAALEPINLPAARRRALRAARLFQWGNRWMKTGSTVLFVNGASRTN